VKRAGAILASLLVTASVISACGGGGGHGGGFVPLGSGPTPTPSPTPSPSPGSPVLPDQPGALAVPAQIFPSTDDWNTDISGYPVDPMSATYIASIGASSPLHADFGTVYAGAPNGIPFIVVAGTQTPVPIDFETYGSESDPGPYPFPSNTPIEGLSPGAIPPPGGVGDQHSLVVDKDHMILYESGFTFPPNAPSGSWPLDANWSANCGAKWDLTKQCYGQRPLGWTSADAAGLPIFAGLVRYDEAVTNGVITHAIRVTVKSSQNMYVRPASHQAGSANTSLPPMGLRIRLKASVSTTGYPPEVTVILKALQKYGMIVADNGSSWYISGAPDSRWSDSNLHTMSAIVGSDFEVVTTYALKGP